MIGKIKIPTWTWPILLVSALSGCQGQETQVLSIRRQGTSVSSVVVAKRALTLSALLDSHRGLAKPGDDIAQVQMFSTKEFAANVLAGKGSTDLDESTWYSRYLTVLANYPSGDMAEFLKIGPDIAARLLVGGKVSRRVISGRDPYFCDTYLLDCEIIWITIGRIPPDEEATSTMPMINLFVKTKEKLSEAAALATANKLQSRFLTEFMTIAFRSDDWFVSDLEFPVIYPFGSLAPTIDPRSVSSHDDRMCVAFKDNFSCQ